MPLASASCRLAVLPPAICSSALQSQRPRKNRAMAFIALSLSTAAPRIALSPQPSGGRAGRVCDAAAGASRGQAVAGVSGALLAWRRQVIAGQWGHGVHRGRRSVALRRRVLDVSKAGTSK
eukprot:s327_g6.t1